MEMGERERERERGNDADVNGALNDVAPGVTTNKRYTIQ